MSDDLFPDFPRLSELELAVAIDACHRAGAANAAHALSRYVTRLQVENDLARKHLAGLVAAAMGALAKFDEMYASRTGRQPDAVVALREAVEAATKGGV